MALDLLDQLHIFGPAFPEPFVRFSLEKELCRRKLLPKTTSKEGRVLEGSWQIYWCKLRNLIASSGAIDAVVAQAYDLGRAQYAHVLSTLSHKSYPKAPALCLARFDELMEIGLEVFTKKYDPYWDIPLNENLPEPVIELPAPDEVETSGQMRLGI